MVAKDSVKSRLDRDDVGLSFTEFSYMLLAGVRLLATQRRPRLHAATGRLGPVGQHHDGHRVDPQGDRSLAPPGSPRRCCCAPTAEVRQVRGRRRPHLAGRLADVALRDAPVPVEHRGRHDARRCCVSSPSSTTRPSSSSTRRRAPPQERRAQRALANAVVALVHGDDAAAKAERAGEALFQPRRSPNSTRRRS